MTEKKPFGDEEIQFPVLCYYKVIAEDIAGMEFVIETTLLELHVKTPAVKGNRSSGGKYVTYNIEVFVNSLETMNAIDAALRNIKGVKMVL
jgi:putative lipoic acid-binding regulatory protein